MPEEHSPGGRKCTKLRKDEFCLGMPMYNLIPQKLVRTCRVVPTLSLLMFLVIFSGPPSAVAQRVVLDGAQVRVEADVFDGQLNERFLAKGGSGWTEIARSHGATRGATSILGAGEAMQRDFSSTLSRTSTSLVEEFRDDSYALRRTVSLYGDGPWVKVTTQLAPSRPVHLHSFVDSFKASVQPDWTYSPSVGGFNPDAKYKAPLILVQSGPLAFAIVPDVLSLTETY